MGKEISNKKASGKQFYISYFVIASIVALILYALFQKPEEAVKMIYRAAGTLGYLFIFLAIVSSEYMARTKKILGAGFIKAHHSLARLGVLLMIIHPLAFAVEEQSILVFLPVFYPLSDFLELAGRPAFYFFLLAAGVAVYRKKYRNWRTVHYLNYLAFLLVSVHAVMIGTDFESNLSRILALTMTVLVMGTFVHKRFRLKIKKYLNQTDKRQKLDS